MRSPIEIKVGAVWENAESGELYEVLAVETAYVCLRGSDDKRFWEPRATFAKLNNLYVLPEFWGD